jgi:type IV pilus assembly protein PilC
VVSGVLRASRRNLSQALMDYPDVLRRSSDRLALQATSAVLKELSESLKWEDELAAQAKKLAMYPAFVGTIVLAVTFFLMIVMVPQMVGFIKNMGQVIPLQTRILIATSDFLVNYWWAVIIVPTVIVVAIKIAAKTRPDVR